MAIQATTQIVYDGPRNCTIQLTGICDGTDDNEVYAIKVDVSELSQPCTRVKIKRVPYDVSYGIVKLSWDDAPEPKDFLLLDGEGCFDFSQHDRKGPLPPNASEAGNGDILLSTVGFELNSTYSITLELVKSY